MKWGKISSRDPRPDRSAQPLVSGPSLWHYIVQEFGTEMPFTGPSEPNLFALRKKPSSQQEIDARADVIIGELYSNKGHRFANMGISAATIVVFDSASYLLLTTQVRGDKDFADDGLVRKLNSEYLKSAAERANPLKAMVSGLSEEVVAVTPEETVLPIELENFSEVSKPFSGLNYDGRVVRLYRDSGRHLQTLHSIRDPRKTILFNDGSNLVSLCGGTFGNPGFMVHAGTNSGQIIFPFRIDGSDLEETKATLHHAEDNFIAPGKPNYDGRTDLEWNDRLETILRQDSKMLLFELGNSETKLTGRVYTFENGQRVPYKGDAGKLLLSEAFAPHRKGIVPVDNIRFLEYLANQEKR